MNIILLRHTKTICARGVCYGQSDVLPDDTFEEEIKKVINKLAGLNYTTVYSSPLKRCLLLANSIAEHQDIIIDERLKELNFGNWEMKHWDDISKTSYAEKWFSDYINMPCPNGESYAGLRLRIKQFIADLKQKNTDENVLIVTHGGPIRAFFSILKAWSVEKSFNMKIDYGSIFTLSLSGATERL